MKIFFWVSLIDVECWPTYPQLIFKLPLVSTSLIFITLARRSKPNTTPFIVLYCLVPYFFLWSKYAREVNLMSDNRFLEVFKYDKRVFPIFQHLRINQIKPLAVLSLPHMNLDTRNVQLRIYVSILRYQKNLIKSTSLHLRL